MGLTLLSFIETIIILYLYVLLLNTLMYTKTLSHTNSNYVIVFNVHVQEIVPYTEILDRSSSWSFATTPMVTVSHCHTLNVNVWSVDKRCHLRTLCILNI